MHLDELPQADEIVYLPLADRPRPRPDDFHPGSGWTGDRYVRMKATGDPEVADGGVPHSDEPPKVPEAETAATARICRSVARGALPARRLVLAEAVSDDPGLWGLHGPRIGGSLPNPDMRGGQGDRWQDGGAERTVELPVGGILASRCVVGTDEGRAEALWTVWRVTPGGREDAVFMVEYRTEAGRYVNTRYADTAAHQRIAELIDEPLEAAFARWQSLQERREERMRGGRRRIAAVRAAVERWRALREGSEREERRKAAEEEAERAGEARESEAAGTGADSGYAAAAEAPAAAEA